MCLPVNIKSSENSCEKICGCDPCTIKSDSCNPYNKCGENGVCNKKEDCKEGLKCGKRNCMKGMFKKDCCYDPKTSGPKPGEKDFCHHKNKCGENEGIAYFIYSVVTLNTAK